MWRGGVWRGGEKQLKACQQAQGRKGAGTGKCGREDEVQIR